MPEPLSGRLDLMGCQVDLAQGLVIGGPHPGPLTTKEHACLAHLVAQEGRSVSREALHAQVWGYKPGVISRAADSTVNRLRKKLEADPRQPQHLLTVFGEGYRYLGPPPRPVQAPPAAPAPSGADPDLVGRDPALQALCQAVGGGTVLLNLVGPGGVGKTRLARTAARALAPQLPSRFCPLATAVDQQDLLLALCSTLDIPREGASLADLEARLLDWLRRSPPVLLVLDNIEQLHADLAGLLPAWTAAGAQVQWLLTSRVRLGLPAEQTMPLAPLHPDDACTLLRRRAQARRGGMDWGPTEEAALPQLVQRLDCLPLALELAAGRAAVLSMAQLAARLDDRFALLRTQAPGVEARHATLHAAIEWSWSPLPPDQQTLLMLLATLRCPFDLSDAEALLSASGGSPGVALDALQELGDGAWLSPARTPGDERRMRLFESTRAFAQAQSTARGQTDAHMGAMAQHRSQQAQRWVAALSQPEGASALAALERHRPDLLAAFWWARAQDSERAGTLAMALDEVLAARGPMQTHREVLDAALALPLAPQTRASLLSARGQIAWRASDAPAFTALQAEAAALAASVGATQVQAVVAIRQVYAPLARGEARTAQAVAERALSLARETGQAHLHALALAALGDALRNQGQGQLPAAIDLYERALSTPGLAPMARERIPALRYLAACLPAQDQAPRALSLLQEAMGIAEHWGLSAASAAVGYHLAEVAEKLGQITQADQGFAQALEAALAIGAQHEVAFLRLNRGWYLLCRDQVEEAARQLDALPAGDGAADQRIRFHSALARAMLHHARGQFGSAQTALEGLLPQVQAENLRPIRRQIHLRLAAVQADAGDPAAAARLIAAESAHLPADFDDVGAVRACALAHVALAQLSDAAPSGAPATVATEAEFRAALAMGPAEESAMMARAQLRFQAARMGLH